MTDKEARENIAANVLALLEDRGWSQAELAERAGESRMNISRLCRGQNTPTVTTLARVAEAFRVSMDMLLAEPKEFLRTPA